jgi:PRC-barrel domain
MVNDAADNARLCFLESRRLQAPLVDRFDVWTRTGRRLGTFEGVVVDAFTERARYIVVDGGRLLPDWRLVPLPAQLDVVHQALRVQVEEPETAQWTKFNPSQFRRFNPDNDSTATQLPRR